MPVFDSVNNVLLYPYINSLADSRPTLLIYHPDTDTWETDSMYQPDGREVRGNSAVFDPIHNALIVIGGLDLNGDIDPTVTYFFLYRYGNGNGESPLSSDFLAQSLPSRGVELDEALAKLALRCESLQETTFWSSDKAVLILTGNRQIWLESSSNPSLTLRPPHGSTVGVDLVRGHFITDEHRRSKTLVSTR